MPVWKQKYRPLTWPSPIGRMSPAAIPLTSNWTAAARQSAERRFGPRHTGRDLVERAIAAEADDDVDPATGSILGKPDGMPAAVGLDDLYVIALGESPMHDHGVTRRHRGGKRVDDQQDAQDSDDIGRARGWVSAVLRGNNGPP